MLISSKIILCIIFILAAFELSAQGSWININSPVTTDLRICCFTDENNAWAAGDEGVIIHSSDGGNTFELQNSTINFYINDIYFLNSRLGWAVANEFLFSGTTILKTTNSGINWIGERFPDSSKFFKTIYFLDSLTGYMGGFAGAIYKTSNGGISWQENLIDSSEFSSYPVSKINFATPSLGFACGGYTDIAGVIWRTTNGGLSWNAGNYSSEPFYDIYIKNPLKIISAGGDFEYGVQLCYTSNSGTDWIYNTLGMFGQAYSIDFRTPREAWMPLGYSGTWAFSNDSGYNWVSIPVINNSELYSVEFSDSLHGIAVGRGGVIMKYVPQIVHVNNNNSEITSFKLYQNYPNPFNPTTNLEFGISDLGFVSLKVYDVLGSEVVTLVNERKNAGTYRVEFDGSNLSSGVYFYKLAVSLSNPLASEDYTAVKRMVLIR